MPDDDGGWAFPTASPPDEYDRPGFVYHGMTLRDWFAGQALCGLAANMARYSEAEKMATAKIAYGLADEMLKVMRDA